MSLIPRSSKAVKRYEGELSERGFDPGDNKGRNLRFIRSDARFLCEYFEDHEVDRIYLNFSDPWPKDKNANKRLTSPQFLRLYDRILKKDGRIYHIKRKDQIEQAWRAGINYGNKKDMA